MPSNHGLVREWPFLVSFVWALLEKQQAACMCTIMVQLMENVMAPTHWGVCPAYKQHMLLSVGPCKASPSPHITCKERLLLLLALCFQAHNEMACAFSMTSSRLGLVSVPLESHVTTAEVTTAATLYYQDGGQNLHDRFTELRELGDTSCLYTELNRAAAHLLLGMQEVHAQVGPPPCCTYLVRLSWLQWE